VAAQPQVFAVVDETGATTRPRKADVYQLGQARVRTARHEGNPVRHQDCLIHVVRDHEHRAAARRPHPHQLVLDNAPREGVDLGEGLVEEQYLRFRRERAREPHALPHAA